MAQLPQEMNTINGISEVRTNGAGVINCLLDTVMLYNGMYFRLGIKRSFKELEPLNISPLFVENINTIIHSKAVDEIMLSLKAMLLYVEDYISVENKREKPSAQNIAGSYDEKYEDFYKELAKAESEKLMFSENTTIQNSITKRMKKIRSQLSDANIMDHFDRLVFESIVEKIIWTALKC